MILVGVGSWVSRRLKGGRLPAVGHAPGGRCGRPRGSSLAVTESALWPSRKVSGPRLLRLAGSLPLPNIYCFRHAVCARAANIDHPILRASFSACGGYPVRLDGLGCSHSDPPCPLPNGIDDPATGRWARARLGRTTLATAVSAMDAVCAFTSDSWISQVDVPTAVIVTDRDRVVPPGRQLELARAIPGASVRHLDADHGACVNAPHLFAPALLEACWPVAPGRSSTLRTPA